MKMLFFNTAPMGDLEFSIVGLILALLAFAAVIAALLVVVFIVIGGLLVLYYDILDWFKKRREAKNTQ